MDSLEKIENRDFKLSDEEILELLNIENNSRDYYRLLYVSDSLSREKFKNRGYVFTQIGINAEPCSINCRFCSMGAEHFSLDAEWEKDFDTLRGEIARLGQQNYDELFLMTTADYPIERFLDISKKAKSLLKPHQRLVANIGDFDEPIAKKLKSAGLSAVYHINRMREGEDTMAQPADREKTIKAILNTGLDLYYCIEPIGPEHSYEEILKEIKRARDLEISVMAVMRRIPVPGTPLFDKGKIPARELAKIVAVTNIVVNPQRSMNVHEPAQMAMMAGVNQLYAEVGANPRDVKSDTEKGRGFTPDKAWEMLWEAGYKPADNFN
ncbi:MAG TPA: radical SAM protein [Mariniphaga anaerophila]|uniref:Radical SAM protein n=1 Tax=Mariniphaga anaerophila TaxID=1484053 RepID=A0A831LL85_9BACT|nr:radical SAM protein [Mariniphaga anaerophila]